jgi:uncharacterized membrane protein
MIANPLQMNDWGIKKFLKAILAIQLAMWSVIGLNAIGLQIPILRQFVSFIYLTFVPGIIICRILKLHKLGNIETLLYTVGLSIATLMFTGLFVNTVYPLFGISKPISLLPLIISISAVVLVLCILSYVRDKDFYDPSFIDVGNVLSPPALFLCSIPFLAVFGTYLVNFHHNNILLMFLIVIIALIALLIGFDRFIPKNLYPLAVFVIAISLLYHASLISMYIWGWDIQGEYLLCNIVKINDLWNPTICSNLNAMLAIVMLAPIFSDTCGMNPQWIFKIIYPLLFSLVPLGLYRVYQKQTDDRIAFLACFFFVSLFTFYGAMLELARQQIAELFLVLLILAMIDKGMRKTTRSFLFIVFGISLVVSHYGLSYIYMFCLISAWLLLILAENPAMQKLMNNFYSKLGRSEKKPVGNPIFSNAKDRTISSVFVLLFITFTLAWYMYVSSSSAFNSIVYIGDHMASSIFIEFLSPEAAQGLNIITTKTVSPLHSVAKYLHLLSLFFIAVGIITLILKCRDMKFEREYVAFSLVAFGICLGGIALPYFASALNTSRLYQITLIFLAPFCVIGGITVFRMLSRVVRASWTNESVKSSLKVLSLFFAIFLLFNSGWVYEVTKDNPTSKSLSNYMDNTCCNEKEAFGAKWLSANTDSNSIVYGDEYGRLLLGTWFHLENVNRKRTRFPMDFKKIREDAYIFLRSWNIEKHEVVLIGVHKAIVEQKHVNFADVPELYDLITAKNKVYDNEGSQIFSPRRY